LEIAEAAVTLGSGSVDIFWVAVSRANRCDGADSILG